MPVRELAGKPLLGIADQLADEIKAMQVELATVEERIEDKHERANALADRSKK